MKRIGKTITAMVLTISISLAALPSPAYARTLTEDQKADYAGQYLADVIKLILHEYVGGDVTVEELYEAALHGMTDILDPYSVYFSEEEFESFVEALSGQMSGVGIYLDTDSIGNIYIQEIIDASPAHKSGLEAGDRIKKINGQSTTGLTTEEVVALVKNGGEEVLIQILRNVEEKEFVILKGSVKMETVFVRKLEEILPDAKENDNNAMRYMYIESISEETDKDLQKYLEKFKSEGVKSLILDLRGNSGGYMNVILSICNMLVPKGPIMHTQGNNGKETYYSRLEKSPFENMVILTDGLTASAAEVLTAALQDAEAAVVVGQTTYGKGVIQQTVPLSTGGVLKLTIQEYFRPNGGKINEVGVIPDVVIDLPNYILKDITLDAKNTGEGVTNLKKLLRYLGYDSGDLNDIYDSKTQNAVTRFQNDNGLFGNGSLTKSTLEGFNRALATSISKDDQVLKKAYELLQTN